MKESSNEEKDTFIQENQLLFKKYKLLKQIGKGTFSDVYLSINTKTNSYVAIKAEKRNQKGVELLESEAFLLYSIRGFGIPQVLSYGRIKTHNILVLPLLGKSLLDLFILRNKNIHINDICLIAIQILERIEWVHSNNIVYRDIKPENFLFGKKDPEVLYLIDFGLCRKYKSSNTGKHILPKNLGKFTGTSRYASVYAMAGNEQSRRDDIESIGYMIIFLMKKKLPWQGIKGNSYKECYHKLYLMKKYIDMEELCKGLPKEMIDYMNNAKSLKFEQEPNYEYLKNLFNTILKKNNFNFDKNIFSWIQNSNNNIKPIKSNSVGKASNNKMARKSSPQNRLYNQIKKSIENKKIIPINANLKQSQKSEKTDYSSANTEQNNLKSNSIDKLNKHTHFLSYPKKSKESSSELSNTMKVMLNKNINSGYNENIGNFPKVNSGNNIFQDYIFSNKMTDEQKGKIKYHHYSPENIRFNNNFYINSQYFSNRNNTNDENSNNFLNKNQILKKNPFLKNNNSNNNSNIISNNKIIKISTPNKNIKNYQNLNLRNNNLKINQMRKININNNVENINKNKNNNSLSNKQYSHIIDNITYNTYNTYNTFNSFNDNLDKTNTNNNNNSNNIPNSENLESSILNKKRINHIIYQKNNTKINYSNKNRNFIQENNESRKNNQNNKIIYLDIINPQRKINSVNIRKNPINGNINLKKNNQNIILQHFNKRLNSSSAQKEDNYLRPAKDMDDKIKKNNNINLIRNIVPKGIKINKINNRNNISNLRLIQNNSFNNKNKNNLIINPNIKNFNRTNDSNLTNYGNDSLRKGSNSSNNILLMKNQNNLKRICIINNKEIIKNKIENNNNYIRLDKMKNNLNNLRNVIDNNSSNKSSEIRKNEFIPKYNSYKINSLKKIPNNSRFFLKRVFQSYKYQTENDLNSVLIHKNTNNNLGNINLNVNENNSVFIRRNKNNLPKIDNLIKKNENPVFMEIEPRIVNNNKSYNSMTYENNNSGNIINKNNKNQINNNYLREKFKTENIESNNNSNESNENDMNKKIRINKYKMIRYKGSQF